MQDTIAMPRDMVDRIESVIKRLVAQVEPKDTEAQAARKDAVALVQDVVQIAEDDVTQHVNAAVQEVRDEMKGAQVLLELSQKARREGWSAPADFSTNHDTYFVKAWEEQEAAKPH